MAESEELREDWQGAKWQAVDMEPPPLLVDLVTVLTNSTGPGAGADWDRLLAYAAEEGGEMAVQALTKGRAVVSQALALPEGHQKAGRSVSERVWAFVLPQDVIWVAQPVDGKWDDEFVKSERGGEWLLGRPFREWRRAQPMAPCPLCNRAAVVAMARFQEEVEDGPGWFWGSVDRQCPSSESVMQAVRRARDLRRLVLLVTGNESDGHYVVALGACEGCGNVLWSPLLKQATGCGEPD